MTSPEQSGQSDTPPTPQESPSAWAVPPAAPEPGAAPDPLAQSTTPDIPEPPPLPPTAQQPGWTPPTAPQGYTPPGGQVPTTYAPPSSPPPSDQSSMLGRMGGPNNLLGWLALVFGIIGTGCCCCWFLDGAPFFGGIPAIILGFLHLQRVKQRRASMGWLGWVGIVLGVIALLGAICNFTTHWNDDLYDQIDQNN